MSAPSIAEGVVQSADECGVHVCSVSGGLPIHFRKIKSKVSDVCAGTYRHLHQSRSMRVDVRIRENCKHPSFPFYGVYLDEANMTLEYFVCALIYTVNNQPFIVGLLLLYAAAYMKNIILIVELYHAAGQIIVIQTSTKTCFRPRTDRPIIHGSNPKHTLLRSRYSVHAL